MKNSTTGLSVYMYQASGPWSIVGANVFCADVDYHDLGTSLSVSQCQAAVLGDPACGVYAESDGNHCYCPLDGVGCDMKNSTTGLSVYMYQASGPWSIVGANVFCADVDYHDLGTSLSVSQCQAAVLGDPACGVYAESDGNHCYCPLDGVGCD